MAERIAVHEQKRRALAAVDGDNARAASLDFSASEVFEHRLFDRLSSLRGAPVGATKQSRIFSREWIASLRSQ
jgi:hypothetical protein